MVALQWMSVSMLLIVLSFVQLNASKHRSVRQVTIEECPLPNVTFCDLIQCVNGRCVENKTSTECFKCECAVGFTGKLCETAIPGASGCNPVCQNGATCQLTAASTFVCICPPEFTGSQCQTSIFATHPCITMPGSVCLNGGNCTISGSNYLCRCPMGWNGTNCQTPQMISQCNPNPCGIHGTCLQANSTNGQVAFCNCEDRWTGRFCDINLNATCSAGYCLSGGTCNIVGNTPICQCPPTHTGSQCETLISIFVTTTTTRATITPILGSCTSNSCLNGGSCYNTGNQFICLCRPEWSGATCTVPSSMITTTTQISPVTNACASYPCSNGGSCYKHGNGYVCVCTSQFTGPTCALVKPTTVPIMTTPISSITCANRPCQNGGTCYANGNSYFCYCGSNSNYSGNNCETLTGPTIKDCPLNCAPGYCIRSGGIQSSYACMCNGTLTPTSCQTN